MSDVVKRLEDEKKQLLNLEARCTFVTDIDVSLQVCNKVLCMIWLLLQMTNAFSVMFCELKAHKDVVEIKEEYDPVKEEEWRKG